MLVLGLIAVYFSVAQDDSWGVDNPDFSPSAAVGRLSKYLSQNDFETLFPYRYGSDAWKRQAKQNSPSAYWLTDIDAEKEYYSYDNFVKAIEFLADIKVKIDWRTEANGDLVNYAPRTSVYRKSTGLSIVASEHGDFNADWNLNKRIFSKIVDLGSFLAEGDENDRKREVAALLANFAHETGGHMRIDPSGASTTNPDDELWWGLYWKEEVGYISHDSIGYVDESSVEFPPVPGKSYHGRGPIQLSYNYNYGRESVIFYQDRDVLLNNPELVADDGMLGFMTGLAFWMTPDGGKPSCHDVMVGAWKPNVYDVEAGRTSAGFGMTILIINGGLEGDCDRSDARVNDRIVQYERIALYNRAELTDKQLDTKGMKGSNWKMVADA